MRGQTSFRQMRNEYQFAKYLFVRHGIIPIDLGWYNLKEQYKLLKQTTLLIYISGSAGLASINCSASCQIIEISPRSIFYADVERQDSVARGGPHILYVCDSQSNTVSHTGDPVWLSINHQRFSNLIRSVNDKF